MNYTKITTLFALLLFSTIGLQAQKAWSLKDCINYAVENNISIKQGELNSQSQQNNLTQAKAQRLPNLSSNLNQSFSYGRSMTPSNVIVNQNSNYSSFGLNTNIPLFAGMQITNDIKRNRVNLDASLKDLEKAKDDIKINIAYAYLEILFAEELVKVRKSQLDITQLQINQTNEKVKAGSLAKGSLLNIQAQAAMEESVLIEAQNSLQLNYLKLVQLLELETYENFNIEKPILPEVQAKISLMPAIDIYNAALQIRPEIKSAEFKMTSSAYYLKMQKGRNSPSLNFGAGYSNAYSSISPQSFSEQLRQNEQKNLRFSLQIPIFNRLQTKTSIHNAKLELQNKELELAKTKKRLREDIETSQTSAVGALNKYSANGKAVVAMKESFRNTEEKFNVGLVNAVEYNLEKSKLATATSELLQAKYQFIFSTKILDFYRGIEIDL
jgi:outer membrane protein